MENFSSESQNSDTKRDYLAGVLQGLNPDAVALQEVLNDEAAQALADALGYHATVASGDGRGNRVAFLTRSPIVGQLEQITAWRLPQGVQVFDFDKYRNVVAIGALPRPALKITVAHEGTEIDLINVHLKSKLLTFPGGKFSTDDEELRANVAHFALQRRAAEATTVRRQVNDLLAAGRNVVVLGDMNDGTEAATTVVLYGPSGGQPRGPGDALAARSAFQRQDADDAPRLFNVTKLVAPDLRWSRKYYGELELLDQVLASEGLMPRGGDLRQVPAMSILNADAPNMNDYPRNQEVEPDHAPVTAGFQV